MAIVSSPVDRVGVLAQEGSRVERVRVVVLGGTVMHVDILWVQDFVGVVHHMLHDHLVQLWVLVLVWKLGGDNAVVLLRTRQLVSPVYDEKEMYKQKTPLLELDYIHLSSNFAKDVLLSTYFLSSPSFTMNTHTMRLGRSCGV